MIESQTELVEALKETDAYQNSPKRIKLIETSTSFLFNADDKLYKIKKFGNLIIIKHNQSWVTAYSNLGKSSVEIGDKIKKQQIIAYTPENKNYFHFQLRHNRNPVNPLSYLN